MIRDLIPREADAAGSRNDPGIDWRLHLGRGYVAASESFVETDLIFVHDLVLPCAIGAYDFERGHTQNVRFNIDADVQRNDRRLTTCAAFSPTMSLSTRSKSSSGGAMSI